MNEHIRTKIYFFICLLDGVQFTSIYDMFIILPQAIIKLLCYINY